MYVYIVVQVLKLIDRVVSTRANGSVVYTNICWLYDLFIIIKIPSVIMFILLFFIFYFAELFFLRAYNFLYFIRI